MAIKGSRGGQFRPSSRRFSGYEGLAEYVGMDDPEEANDAVASAKPYTRSVNADVHIGDLAALHDIDKDRAREIAQSIKSKGFDPNEPIEVLGDPKYGGIVLDGHHRAVAAAVTGMRKIPAVVYDPGDIERTMDTLRSYR